MIYHQFGSIHSDDNITSHLFPDFHSIWKNGLVGISWSYVASFIMLWGFNPFYLIPTKLI